jgi:short-subunit dehydrogenase
MSLRRADDTLRVALVTGACSGIGLEMARLLAGQGYTLCIVSHREAPLAAAADEIRAAHGVPVHPIVLDLARPEAAGELHGAVAALGLEVDLLVNNAGMFFFGEAADADPAKANALLQLHVVTPSLLSTLFARGMRERRRGHVLFVSSISAWRDFPGISYYGSSKKYLRGFAAALRSELAPYGVHVTCLLPGATATGLYDPSVVPVDLAKRLGVMMDAQAVARAGLSAMFRGEAEHIPGALGRLMVAAAVATPQPVIDALRRWGPWLRKPS